MSQQSINLLFMSHGISQQSLDVIIIEIKRDCNHAIPFRIID
jgi:hypothetical protein